MKLMIKKIFLNRRRKNIITAILTAAAILVSMFVIAPVASSPKIHEGTIRALDDKKTTVLELTAASTAASAAVTLIPGDVGTPIAEKLADLSSYFLIVLTAVFLEKYMVTITGYIVFKFLVPAALLLLGIYCFYPKHMLRRLAFRLVVFGFVLFSVIPVSVSISSLIEKTYRQSIQETMESAKNTTDEISGDGQSTGEEKSALSALAEKIKDGVSGAAEKLKNMLNRFIEALAVLIVTSCLIPVAVIFFFIWLVKTVWGIDPGRDFAQKRSYTKKQTMV